MAALASAMRAIEMWTDGPDAEMDMSVAERLEGYAELIEAMSVDS